MSTRTFLQSLNEAVDGFIYVVRHERNMRVHFLFAFFVLLLAIFLGVSRIEWIILCSITCFVLVAEMMNTAIEEIIDLVKSSYHPAARIVKHISAGIVLVTAINALIVGFFIFSKYLKVPFEGMVTRVRYAPTQITFIALLVSIFLVVAGKAFIGRGTPFRGGPISGHAAVAFGLWMIVVLSQSNTFVMAICFLMALLVAQSRLRAKIHSFWEIVAGALLGTAITALFFKIFA
jgi:diacylglycerol kinase (ATP)